MVLQHGRSATQQQSIRPPRRRPVRVPPAASAFVRSANAADAEIGAAAAPPVPAPTASPASAATNAPASPVRARTALMVRAPRKTERAVNRHPAEARPAVNGHDRAGPACLSNKSDTAGVRVSGSSVAKWRLAADEPLHIRGCISVFGKLLGGTAFLGCAAMHRLESLCYPKAPQPSLSLKR